MLGFRLEATTKKFYVRCFPVYIYNFLRFRVSTDSLILPTGRWLSERRRRRRIAFHQRQMHEKKHLTASTEPIQRETKLAEDVPPVEEVKLEETFTTSPPVIQPTPGEALPAASISHKVNFIYIYFFIEICFRSLSL